MKVALRGYRALGRFGWYPLLLALILVVQVLVAAPVDLAAATRPLIVATVISLLLSAICIGILGRDRGTLIAGLLVVTIISVRNPLIAGLVVAAVLLLLIERRWARQGRLLLPWPRIHEAITILVAILLVMQLGQIAIRHVPGPRLDPSAWADQPLNTGPRPNIYFILADAHGRQDVLRDDYQYDESPFLGGLEGNGFQVASASRANYDLTRFSLASLFTASYLPSLNDDRSALLQDAFAQRSIRDNPAFPLLRRAGYEVDVVSSGYEHLGLRSADHYLDTGQPNEFEEVLLQSVAASSLWDRVDPNRSLTAIRDRTLDELGTLLDLASEAGNRPRFVFAHLPVPHWPFVFDADCGPAVPLAQEEAGINRHGGTPQTIAAARDQTACVDRMLSDAIHSLATSDPNAIIIVMSDHGPDEHLDWWDPGSLGVVERTANLFAARTPGHPGLFPDVLPILFDTYLGANIPLQPNEIWFGPRPQDGRFVRVSP
jgi:Sulfatase